MEDSDASSLTMEDSGAGTLMIMCWLEPILHCLLLTHLKSGDHTKKWREEPKGEVGRAANTSGLELVRSRV
jgi:hypothetical protein